MTLGNRVRRLREQRGEGLVSLAKLVGMEPGHLSKLERGLAGCGDEYKVRLADHFGVSVGELFFQRDISSDETQGAPA